MSNVRLFVDFGSTFTKICAFDMAREELVARAKTPSTVDTDITVGLQNALDLIAGQVCLDEATIRSTCACSSAAGGLRVVCIGLTPELTTEAGRIAAYGAGAKIVGVFSYRLTPEDLDTIQSLAPDVVLLSGGIDGGDKKNIIHNAALLAETDGRVADILVAGNKSAYDEVRRLLQPTGKNVIFEKNILPALNRLQTEHVHTAIRELFISRITKSKGIDKAASLIRGVLMPTPAAVLAAAKLAADGTEEEPGFGDLMIVDVGGATTDVYSVADGYPTRSGVSLTGLPEPRIKRTVEGDLGLFHNLDTLTDAAKLSGVAPAAAEADALSAQLRQGFSIPASEETGRFHVALSRLAVKTAAERHCGSLLPLSGGRFAQKGKDLTAIPTVIGAGGPIVYSPDFSEVLSGILRTEEDVYSLKPCAPRFYKDDQYILYAAGLMSAEAPLTALHLMKKYITAQP